MVSSEGGFNLRTGARRAEPMVWLSSGAVVMALLLLAGLLFLLAGKGFSHFWPKPLLLLQSTDLGPEAQLGTVIDREANPRGDGSRFLVHRGGEEFFDSPLLWINEASIVSRTQPADALVIQRVSQGPVFGFLVDLPRGRGAVRVRGMEQEQRLAALRGIAGSGGPSTDSVATEITLQLASGQIARISVSDVLEIYAPNAMGTAERLGHFLSSLGRFISEAPRRSNVQGGVFPAIVGTVTLVFIMALIVSPLGVLAAVYLQEYAQRGPLTRLVRIAVNNLAGVPSIVFGVFGLGFFVYGFGGSLDRLFFDERLPAPTMGTPGMLWAALTMALLTLPVVIVATEEGLARVPRSLREGSLALGATRAETLLQVVIPAALPAVLTGLILAVARATGEVAPLILVGVAKYAPGLPISGEAPYLHLDRQFMHLGFYIYDLGFQSPYLETAEGLVFATALLLVFIVLLLNMAAVMLRSRLRDRFHIQEIR